MGNKIPWWPEYMDPDNPEHVQLVKEYTKWNRLMNTGLVIMLIIPLLDAWVHFPPAPFAIAFFLGALTNLYVFFNVKKLKERIWSYAPNDKTPPPSDEKVGTQDADTVLPDDDATPQDEDTTPSDEGTLTSDDDDTPPEA